jgi:hypothetical protein
MARKSKAKTKTKKTWTAPLVIADWKKAVKAGLGPRKKLSKATLDHYEPLLLKKIQERLDEGEDYDKAGPNTRAVAKVVGRFCAALAAGNEVPRGIFDRVFDACQLHHRCPTVTGPGSGKWCDV